MEKVILVGYCDSMNGLCLYVCIVRHSFDLIEETN